MSSYRSTLRSWVRRLTARAGVAVALIGLLGAFTLTIGSAGADTALAKRDGHKPQTGPGKKAHQGQGRPEEGRPVGGGHQRRSGRGVDEARGPSEKPGRGGGSERGRWAERSKAKAPGGSGRRRAAGMVPSQARVPVPQAPVVANSAPPATAPVVPAAPAAPAAPGGGQPAGDAPGSAAGGGEPRERSTRRRRAGSGGREGSAPTRRSVRPSPATRPAATAPASSSSAVRESRDAGSGRDEAESGSPVVRTVTRTVQDVVEVVPGWAMLALAALAALSLLLAGSYAVSALRARSLARQRGELLNEVGLLQSALLPSVPERLGALRASVAYRPADGPGAGGDFYDVLPLSGGRVGFVLGDISGHGHAALERTAFMRYTLRAYLEAGLQPRAALQVAGRVIGDGLQGDFATVLVAVHDPHGGSLTYASAGHPAPIVVNGAPFEPVDAASSPPIGVGERTGLRQTTVPLAPGSVACLYTDGLSEARVRGGLMGRERLERILAELGKDAEASDLIERVAAEADATPDDMAACLLSPTAGVTAGGFRTEQIELSAEECEGPLPERFLAACGVSPDARSRTRREAHDVAARYGGAVLSVVMGSRRTVEVLPRNVESLELASRRMAAHA